MAEICARHRVIMLFLFDFNHDLQYGHNLDKRFLNRLSGHAILHGASGHHVVHIHSNACVTTSNIAPWRPGIAVIKLEFILRLKIKRNDWLFADTCPQAANHCALF